MAASKPHHESGPLQGLEQSRLARLAFELLLISADLLELLAEFDHIDRSWVHTHLYLHSPESASEHNSSHRNPPLS